MREYDRIKKMLETKCVTIPDWQSQELLNLAKRFDKFGALREAAEVAVKEWGHHDYPCRKALSQAMDRLEEAVLKSILWEHGYEWAVNSKTDKGKWVKTAHL